MYDVVVIGAGPAGITAAIYSSRNNLKTVVLSKDVGGQTALSGDIENYPGYHNIKGPDLVAKFEENLEENKIETITGVKVTKIERSGKNFKVFTDENKTYETRTVIITSGKLPRQLGVPGENEFRNKGVTYCAICDGPIFKNKDVAIIGGGNSALDATLQMVSIAKKIYLINITPQLGGEAHLRESVLKSKNVEVLNSTKTTAVVGQKMVTGIKVLQGNSERTIAVQGVIVEIGYVPSVDFTDVKKNDYGEIVIDEYNRTNVSGIFAAGDVTIVHDKQIVIAAGEGSKAAISAFEYLSKK